jgi:hypothetical protein
MAGSPQKRAKLEMLDAIEETIFAKLENGNSLADIAVDSGCSRPFLMRWLTYTDDRERRYDKARQTAAHALVDDVQASADSTLRRAIDGRANKTEVAAAKLAGDTKRWLAGRWNSKYQDQQTNVAVTLDMGAAFLNVLRRGNPHKALERGVQPVDEVPLSERNVLTHEQASEAIAHTLGLPAPIEIEDPLEVSFAHNPDKQPVKRLPNLDFNLFDE